MKGAKDEAFKGFDRGQRPSDLNIPGVKRETLYRYFQLWKRGRQVVPVGGGTGTQLASRALVPQGGGALGVGETMARFLAFKAMQQLQAAMGHLRKRIRGCLCAIEEATEEYQSGEVTVADWDERAGNLWDQLHEWALAELHKVQSRDELRELSEVVKGIEGEVSALLAEYHDKVREVERRRREQERLRHEQENRVSRRLIRNSLSTTPAPPFVVRALQKALLVRHESQARTLSKAVWEARNIALSEEWSQQGEEWKAFVDSVRIFGWKCIQSLAEQNDERQRLSYGNIKWGQSLIGPGERRRV